MPPHAALQLLVRHEMWLQPAGAHYDADAAAAPTRVLVHYLGDDAFQSNTIPPQPARVEAAAAPLAAPPSASSSTISDADEEAAVPVTATVPAGVYAAQVCVPLAHPPHRRHASTPPRNPHRTAIRTAAQPHRRTAAPGTRVAQVQLCLQCRLAPQPHAADEDDTEDTLSAAGEFGPFPFPMGLYRDDPPTRSTELRPAPSTELRPVLRPTPPSTTQPPPSRSAATELDSSSLDGAQPGGLDNFGASSARAGEAASALQLLGWNPPTNSAQPVGWQGFDWNAPDIVPGCPFCCTV